MKEFDAITDAPARRGPITPEEVKRVLAIIDAAEESEWQTALRTFRRELMAQDGDALLVRRAIRAAESLRNAADAHNIRLTLVDRWVTDPALKPYAARLSGIFNELSFSPSYLEWQEERTRKLADTICRDKKFMAVLDKWNKLQPHQYRNAADTAGKMQLRLFCEGLIRLPQQKTSVYETPRPKIPDAFLEGGSHLGPKVYQDFPHDVRYNVHPDTNFRTAARGMEVIHHENLHTLQAAMAHDMFNGLIKPGHPLYREARLFMLTAYFEKKTYISPIQETYRAHPIEQDTFAQSARFVAALRAEATRKGVDIDKPGPRL